MANGIPCGRVHRLGVYPKSESEYLVRALLLPQSLQQKPITAFWKQGKAGIVLTCAWMMGSTPSAEISSNQSHFVRLFIGPRPILPAASWRDDEPGILRNIFVSEIECPSLMRSYRVIVYCPPPDTNQEDVRTE